MAALQHAAAGVAPEGAGTEESVWRAEVLPDWAGRAREVRNHIVTTAAILAAIAEEVALLDQDRVTRRPGRPPDTGA